MERWEYGDPETVAIRREENFLAAERACGQCKYKETIEWKGVNVPFCRFKKRKYGKRCELYKVQSSPEQK